MPEWSRILGAAAAAAAVGAGVVLVLKLRERQRRRRVLVVGSINVDLYHRLKHGSATFGGGKPVDVSRLKGMTLPARSFVQRLGVPCAKGAEESFVLGMDGDFEQKTGGKGANAAAAAGQTSSVEFLGNFGEASAAANEALLADLAEFGRVDTSRCQTLRGVPTGTAYILQFDDNDNSIVLLGGANQAWPAAAELEAEGSTLRRALSECAVVMLQREVPPHVNASVARLARSLDVSVFMDVGGTDDPLDGALLPHISLIAPNETELEFISGAKVVAADGRASLALVRDAVASLRARFAEAGNPRVEVLVTLGAEGSIHFGADWTGGGAAESHMGSFRLSTPDSKPRDTTGAGDCFRGSFVAAR